MRKKLQALTKLLQTSEKFTKKTLQKKVFHEEY